jgi:hypothetical protein
MELVLLDLLAPIGPTVTSTGTDVPAGTIQVERIGGPDDGVTDRPRMQVTGFGRTRQHAWQIIGQCRQRILASGGTLVSGENVQNVFIDLARTATPPRQLPEFGRGARIVQAVFEIHVRRQWAAQPSP